jgi:hypothetical protein
LDLASRPYDCSTLYLYEGPNSRMIAYRDPVYINEFRMIDPDSFSKSCRWVDGQRVIPFARSRLLWIEQATAGLVCLNSRLFGFRFCGDWGGGRLK